MQIFKKRKKFNQFQRDLHDVAEDQGLDLDKNFEPIDPVKPPTPSVDGLMAEGLSKAAAESFIFMQEYLTSGQSTKDMEKAFAQRKPGFKQILARQELLPEFLQSYQAVMVAILNKKIINPDPAKVKETIPNLLKRAMDGTTAEFYGARNTLINIANGKCDFR